MVHGYDQITPDEKEDEHFRASLLVSSELYTTVDGDDNNSGYLLEDNSRLLSSPDPESRKLFSQTQSTRYQRRLFIRVYFRPIVVLVVQSVILFGTISFIIWTSVAYRTVPQAVENAYAKYPQFTAAIITEIVIIFSAANIVLFLNAIRLAINASLVNGKTRGMSLYSFYASTTLATRSLLYSLSGGRQYWTFISVILFALFNTQNSAWTTIVTPGPILVSRSSTFSDIDFMTQSLMNGSLDAIDSPWTEAATAGMMAARQDLNMTQLYSFVGQVFNGTTRGILPITTQRQSSNWTNIVASQQGFTADVSCKTTPESDPAFSNSNTTVQVLSKTYSEYSICCSCNEGSGDEFEGRGVPIIYEITNQTSYAVLAVCPYRGAVGATENNIITAYIQASAPWIANRTCSIRPQLLIVNATYNDGGFVTIEPMDQPAIDFPINNSTAVFNAVMTVMSQFYHAQAPGHNSIEDMLFQITNEYQTQVDLGELTKIDPDELINLALAGYFRGLFEHSATAFRIERLALAETTSSPPIENKTSVIHVQAFGWGQASLLSRIMMISPLTIMIMNVLMILYSFYGAKTQNLFHILNFNPMNILHIITACNYGNVRDITFPDYSKDIGAFVMDVGIQLRKWQTDSHVAGFLVYPKEGK